MSPDIISRKEAQEQNLKRYFTGEPCVYDHVSERYTKSCMCVECGRIRNSSRFSFGDCEQKPVVKKLTKKRRREIEEYADYERRMNHQAQLRKGLKES